MTSYPRFVASAVMVVACQGRPRGKRWIAW
jgi:hypothetical protein